MPDVAVAALCGGTIGLGDAITAIAATALFPALILLVDAAERRISWLMPEADEME